MRFILASKSPRRKQLLSELVPDFEIITKDTDESLPEGMHPRDGVEVISIRKGAAVADFVGEDAIVISSDTLVELDGAALGKPHTELEAENMLRQLSAKTHNVHTGVAVHYRGAVFSGVSSSHVTFRSLSDAEISEYVKGGEPMDKAGSYAIQGEGGKFVESYSGDFGSIVGLDLTLTRQLIDRALSAFGEDLYE